MVKEAKTQANVGVGVEALWKALTKDFVFVIPKVIPNLVKEAKVIEGDGGLGTVISLSLGPDESAVTNQKEKIVELDESLHRITMQVVEGGHLDQGFSSYKTTFQLTATAGHETLVDVTTAYESLIEETGMPIKPTNSALFYIKCLENYLLNGAS